MASSNTTTLTDRFVEITFGEAGTSGTDWLCTATGDNGLSCTGGIIIKSMQFYPTQANDVICVRNQSPTATSGAMVWKYLAVAVGGNHRIDFSPPSRMWPVVDVSSCTFGGSTGTAKLLIELA